MKILQTSGVPIYRQIAAAFREDILGGKMKEGDYLPSIRALAAELKVSVITTMKAYETLEEEGLVTAVQGKGFVVNARDSDMVMEQYRREVEKNLIQAVKKAKVAGIAKKELKETIDLFWTEEEEE